MGESSCHLFNPVVDVIRRGGIRAIVQLEILRAIEEALGRHIPIQNFFDLIVGTRFVM